MSIIKIHLFREPNQRQQKYLLTYISDVHLTVKDFLLFAIDALKINSHVDDLIIESNGYMLPHCLKGKLIQKSSSNILIIRVKNTLKQSSPPFGFWTAQKIPQIHSNPQVNPQTVHQNIIHHQNQIDVQSDSSCSTPKFSQDGINILKSNKNLVKNYQKGQSNDEKVSKHKKHSKHDQLVEDKRSKKQSKQQKKAKKRKQEKKKKKKKKSKHLSSEDQEQQQVQQEVSQVVQQSQQQSSEQQQASVKWAKKQQKRDKKQSKKIVQQIAVQEQKQQSRHKHKKHQITQQQPTQSKNKQKNKEKSKSKHKHNKEIQQQEIIEQQQQAQQQKPKLKISNPTKQSQIKLNRIESFGSEEKRLKQNKNVAAKDNRQTPSQLNEEKQSNIKPTRMTVNYSQRKKIIQMDDIQSSDSSQDETIPKIGQTRMNLQEKKDNSFSSQQTKMLPPALRNKIQNRQIQGTNNLLTSSYPKSNSLQSSFKKHMQQQWLNITKQILTQFNKTKSSPNQTFLKVNNVIKFKQIQLDEEKFVPKTSEWIEGTVTSINAEGKLTLSRVTQLGKDYRERYDINQYNMVELQLNRNFLNEEQKVLLIKGQSSKPNIQQKIETNQQKNIDQPHRNQQQQQVSEQKSQQKGQQKNSVQKFICGQVNYYFSDKSYPYDLFMQMHANKHPQKYIPIRFLLNFPKIKKILKDQKKLLEYLLEDEKRENRNYEIDEMTRMVRKKLFIVNNNNKESQQNNKQNNWEDKSQQKNKVEQNQQQIIQVQKGQ